MNVSSIALICNPKFVASDSAIGVMRALIASARELLEFGPACVKSGFKFGTVLGNGRANCTRTVLNPSTFLVKFRTFK